MHYPCTSTLGGSPLVREIKFPMSLYCTSTWLCNPASYMACHVEVLVETDCRIPMVYLKGNALGIINMCTSFQSIVANWFVETSQGTVTKGHIKRSESVSDDLGLDNQRRSSVRSRPTTATMSRTFTYVSHISRPASGVPKNRDAKINDIDIPPCIRCSGPY
jgi:hypothetical protein